MSELRPSEQGKAEPDVSGSDVVVHPSPWGRIAMFAALGLLILLALAIAVVWVQRRPIATHFLKGEFERRGVTASYHLDQIGFLTQQVSDLVIGDLLRAGQLLSSYEIDGIGATKDGRNGGGDPYFTDGKAIVGVLRQIP